MRRVLWTISGALFVSGATWLTGDIWNTSELGGRPYGPLILGALLAGLTIRRAVERGPIGVAASAASAWFAIQGALYIAYGVETPWFANLHRSPSGHLAFLAAISIGVTVAGALPPVRGRPDHPVLWLWISALLTLGTIATSIWFMPHGRYLNAGSTVVMLSCPVIAGGLTQCLAPMRRIWICGGGAWIFSLTIIDRNVHSIDVNATLGTLLGTLFGMGIFVLLGVLGAWIAWRLFRNSDPRAPVADLPIARSSPPARGA
jgi:hypothetical protein